MLRSRRDFFVRVAISVIIFVLLFRYFDISVFSQALGQLRGPYLLGAFAIMPLGILTRAVRWRAILADGGVSISLKDSVSLSVIGVALDSFMPSGTGELGKSYFGYKWLGVKEEMVGSVVIDKIIALLSLFVLGGLSALTHRYYSFFLVSLCSACVLVVLTAFPKTIPFTPLRRVINRVTGSTLRDEQLLRAASLSRRTIQFSVLVSFAGWLLTYLQWYLVCEALGSQVTMVHMLSIAPLLVLARLFPLAISGLGSQEAAAAYLLGLAGVNPTIAVTVSLTVRVLNTVIPAVVGAVLVLKGR